MSDTLLVRHLPDNLTVLDKEEFLKYFGAVKVSIPNPKCHSAFATFSSYDLATQALYRLHQLEIGGRRLVVEFSSYKASICNDSDTGSFHPSERENNAKKFIKALNSWNSSIDFSQPPPPHLKYKYPSATPEIIINIIYSMIKHKPLYTQIIHLMNKMSLDPPFDKVGEDAISYFTQNFVPYILGVSDLNLISSVQSDTTEGSELSSEENIAHEATMPLPLMKRKRNLFRKRLKIDSFLPSKPKIMRKSIINKEEVFDTVTLAETKRISLKVSQELPIVENILDDAEIGNIRKISGLTPRDEQSSKHITTENDQSIGNTLTKQELLENKISLSDMKILPVFKNYHPGVPTQKLYIKNLAKGVFEMDLHRIFKRYIDINDDKQNLMYEVKLMKEGKMKGQAFVTLPTVVAAENALNETNGYILKDKPMVVQFGKVTNKVKEK